VTKILISGLINIETTVRVDGFPIQYAPVRYPFFGVHSTVSGVGYNVAKALHILGDEVCFLALTGEDAAGEMVQIALGHDQLPPAHVLPQLAHTPQSVILYDAHGRRQINVDLKDIQEQSYPFDLGVAALRDCSIAILCNLNIARPFLAVARQMGKLIATDVHAIAHLEDEYNRDFMAAADLLFMSDEWLPTSPEAWVRQVMGHYGAEIVVVGLGAQGVLLGVRRDGFLERIPAVQVRPVVNTIGAGDALFSCFVHFYAANRDPYAAIRKAILFAGHKIGAAGAAEGFLDEASVNRLFAGWRQ